jgi:hypothetical protein
MPDGLAGAHIIDDASCERCQLIINEFEQYCMRTLFGNVRTRLSMFSRKRRPRREASALVSNASDGTSRRVYLPIGKIPHNLMLPTFSTPYILQGIKPPKEFPIGIWASRSPDISAFLSDTGARYMVTEVVVVDKFARLLAKIAHAYVSANLDPAIIKPLLRPAILQEESEWIEFIGTLDGNNSPSRETHFIKMNRFRRPSDGRWFVAVFIRLFGSIGAPTYIAVAAELVGPWPFE